MNVALVQEFVDLRRGGAETATLEMARHLAQLGLAVTIICRQESGAVPEIDGVRILPVAVRGLTRIGRTYRFMKAISAICRRERFDIVHAITPCLHANIYQPRGGTYRETVERTLASTRPGLLRSLRRLGRLFNLRQRFLMRLEEYLLGKYGGRILVAAISDYVRNQVLAYPDVPPERVRVVFNGVDPPAIDPDDRAALRREVGVADDDKLVLFVAHNFKLKGLATALRAAAVGDADWTLAVAGRGAAGGYQRLAQRLGLAERVRFVGTDTPMQRWYAAADVLAHPTWYDPCSRVVLEALTVGLPVVTTRYNGAAEVMEPGRHGAIIDDPRDHRGLAGAIGRAMQPEVRAACQADAPRMRDRLSMARHTRELKALYDEVLASR